MKNLILLIIVMVIGACATTSTKPVKELTLREKVVGTYERKIGEDTFRMVLLENGISEGYINGKRVVESKWKISKDGELHITNPDGFIGISRINTDGSLTHIADISKDGKREDIPKEHQITAKKIK